MRRTPALLLALALAACAGPLGGGVDVAGGIAAVPPGTFGAGDQDIAAANLAQYDFADTNRIYGKPADAARGAAALDYLAGELQNGTRWPALSADSREAMLASRIAVREAVGIAPGAPAQDVVNALLAAAAAIDSGDAAATRAALANPVFTLAPAQTLDRLGDIPYMQSVNVAIDRAANEVTQVTEANPCPTCSAFYSH